jgi:hypothetical protein
MNRIANILLLTLCLFPAARGADPIGTVKNVRGATQIKRGTEILPAREGMHLAAHDILLTATDGYIGVILQDGSRISLGPHTELGIDQFVFDPGRGNLQLLLKMARGILTYISGRIAELSPDSVRLETPVGILGMRGTHVGIRLE